MMSTRLERQVEDSGASGVLRGIISLYLIHQWCLQREVVVSGRGGGLGGLC